MNCSLKIKQSARKDIEALVLSDRQRVIAAIDQLLQQPLRGTLLKGGETGLRRLRVGNYRIIYEVQASVLVVLVLRVGHRREVYR